MAKAQVGDRSGRPTTDSDDNVLALRHLGRLAPVEFVAGGSTIDGAGGLERSTTEILGADPSSDGVPLACAALTLVVPAAP
jgi:hypothetical protein